MSIYPAGRVTALGEHAFMKTRIPFFVVFALLSRGAAETNGQGVAKVTDVDVEGEINGLVSYDRKVIKISAEKLAEMHKKLISK